MVFGSGTSFEIVSYILNFRAAGRSKNPGGGGGGGVACGGHNLPPDFERFNLSSKIWGPTVPTALNLMYFCFVMY